MQYAAEALVFRFFSGTGPSYDRIVDLCTFGCDRYWKERIVQKVPPRSRLILDQACGTGILTLKIARRIPGCEIVAVDLQREYLKIAQSKARRQKLTDLRFIEGRAEDVVLKRSVDCIASSYLAKYVDLVRLVDNARRMLHSGGVLVMHDFVHPTDPHFASLWRLHFKLLHAIGTRFFPQWLTVFEELPGLLQKSNWVPDLVDCLRRKGFTSIRVQALTLHTAAIVTARRP